MRRQVVVLAAFMLWLCVLYAPRLLVYAQTTPVWCEVFVDCLGSGGKVGAQDDLNRRAYTMGHVDNGALHIPQRTSANCSAETGGIANETCYETGPPRKIFVCDPGPCNGANWQEYASRSTLDLASGVVPHTSAPPPLDITNCTNTNHYNQSVSAKSFTLCDPAILNPITGLSAGNTLCFIDNAGGAMTITPQPTHTITLNDGTTVIDKAAGASIVSTGVRGQTCCMQATSSTTWVTRVCQGFS